MKANRRTTIAAILFISVCLLPVLGQETPKKQSPSPQPVNTEKGQNGETRAKPGFSLSVKTTPILNLSLKAEKVKLTEIAAELAKKLKTQVFVSQNLKEEVVSLEFSELTLEPAVRLMAPMVYVDYEIESGSETSKPLGIFFNDANSGQPPLSAVINGTNESILIEGDTEEGVEPESEEDKKRLEEQPLRIQFQDNRLSLKAKKQPLVLVLLKIGSELSIPVDIQYNTDEIVDIDLSKVSVEDVMHRLAPNIRLFVRADLTNAERRTLRLALVDPARPLERSL